jgi:hypothetical protein
MRLAAVGLLAVAEGAPAIINSTNVVHTVSESFLSFTMDISKVRSGFRGYNFTEPVFLALAQTMAPALLRIGGTGQDNYTYDMSGNGTVSADASIPAGTLTAEQWDEINEFTSAAGWSAVFGLNALRGIGTDGKGNWDSTNAVSLLEYTKLKGYNVVGWELGNEQNLDNKGLKAPLEPAAYARSFGALRAALLATFGTVGGGTRASPWLIGPDTTKGTQPVKCVANRWALLELTTPAAAATAARTNNACCRR